MSQTLHSILTDLMTRFDVKFLQAHSRSMTIGFITPAPNSEQYAIELTDDTALLLDHIQTADLVLQATLDLFSDGLLGENTTKLVQQTHIVGLGGIPSSESILQHFLETFALPAPSSYPQSDKPYFAMPIRPPRGENLFGLQEHKIEILPQYDAGRLPRLVADAHPEWVAMYDKAWQLAFSNLRQAQPESGFTRDYIDTAFNGNIFMWDSCFMMMFGCYGHNLFDFIGTLDNFYVKQHADGFICREISGQTGQDMFTPFDSRSTGPNILAWTEWLVFQTGGDLERLRKVFPALVAYHRWLRDWRKWPDGSYWTSNLGSGMDNQTRVAQHNWHHANHSWVDATMQQALNCRILLEIGQTIGDTDFDAEFTTEYEHLQTFVNEQMWDETSGFYYDVSSDGNRSQVKSIGAFWGLLAGIVPRKRFERMIEQLNDPKVFNRFHRVPSQSADSLGYETNGQYWRGGVWSPTNYMILQALSGYHEDELAHDIARNHVDIVAKVFLETSTLWENYAPEQATPSSPSKQDFVGWTGISAISIPIEFLIGLRPDKQGLVWDIRLTERHGVLAYSLGKGQSGDFICHARTNQNEAPKCSVKISSPLQLMIKWQGKEHSWPLAAGEHSLEFPDKT